MIRPRHNKLQVPVEISRYVYHNGLISPFSIYLYLKLFSDGKLHDSSPVFTQMRADLRMKDNRTFKKHMNKLHELGWVGHNKESGYYFIRSFDYLRFSCTCLRDCVRHKITKGKGERSDQGQRNRRCREPEEPAFQLHHGSIGTCARTGCTGGSARRTETAGGDGKRCALNDDH